MTSNCISTISQICIKREMDALRTHEKKSSRKSDNGITSFTIPIRDACKATGFLSIASADSGYCSLSLNGELSLDDANFESEDGTDSCSNDGFHWQTRDDIANAIHSYSNSCHFLQKSKDDKDKVIACLRAQLEDARLALQLRDEECANLVKLREQMNGEVTELTGALFEEANKSVQEALSAKVIAQRNEKEAKSLVDLLRTEVSALKTLLITSTPNAPNMHLHPPLDSSAAMMGKVPKEFSNQYRRSSSYHDFTKQEHLKSQQNQHCIRPVKEVDQDCFDDFRKWKANPAIEDDISPFLCHVLDEDIKPCLTFHNIYLSECLLFSVQNNTLEIVPIAENVVISRWCALSERSQRCDYKMRLGDAGEWLTISQMCRERITAVCNFYAYIRYILRGYVKGSDKQIFTELLQYRMSMSMARLGWQWQSWSGC